MEILEQQTIMVPCPINPSFPMSMTPPLASTRARTPIDAALPIAIVPPSVASNRQFSRAMHAACAAYLGRARWPNGFVCPHCGLIAEPFCIVTRPGVLDCRACRRQTGLLVGTVMERSHTPLSVWFWAAYLVASQTPGMSAVQFQRQLGLTRYETAFGILHKLRAGMVRTGPGPHRWSAERPSGG